MAEEQDSIDTDDMASEASMCDSGDDVVNGRPRSAGVFPNPGPQERTPPDSTVHPTTAVPLEASQGRKDFSKCKGSQRARLETRSLHRGVR